MTSFRRTIALTTLLVAATVGLAACGSQGIDLPEGETAQIKHGADLFSTRCSGCHTLEVAGTQGSATKASTKLVNNGPNFNVRRVSYRDALYAIRNGGFSSGPMPQNLVVGADARAIAAFLDKYSGKSAPTIPTP